MKTEIEVKFYQVDVEDIRRRLRDADATLVQPMRLMRRALIEEPQHQQIHSFIRIRDEGDKVTLTYKRRSDSAASQIDGTKEIEVVVSDFEDTVMLFQEAGWQYKTFQESKRETWQLGGAEIVIDEWPWLQPYIEIEADSESEVRDASEKLGLSWDDKLIGHLDALYEKEYEFAENFRGVIDVREVRFDAPLPKQLKAR